MAKEKAVNYTDEMTQRVVHVYTHASDSDEARAEAVETLAQEFGKTKASIRQKLVREGVYKAKTRKTKAGGEIVRKSDIVSRIAKEIDVEAEQIESLEKATKPALLFILNAVHSDED